MEYGRRSIRPEDMNEGYICALIMRGQIPAEVMDEAPTLLLTMSTMRFHYLSLFKHSKHLNIPILQRTYEHIAWYSDDTVDIRGTYRNVINLIRPSQQLILAAYLGSRRRVKRLAEVIDFMEIARNLLSKGLFYVDPFILGYYKRYVEGRPLPPKAIALIASHCVREKYYYPLKNFYRKLPSSLQKTVIAHYMKSKLVHEHLTCEHLKLFHFFTARMSEDEKQTLLRNQPYETLVYISFIEDISIFSGLFQACVEMEYMSCQDAFKLCMTMSDCSCGIFQFNCLPGPICQFQRIRIACQCFWVLFNQSTYSLISVYRELVYNYPIFLSRRMDIQEEILCTLIQTRVISDIVRRYEDQHPELLEGLARCFIVEDMETIYEFMALLCEVYNLL